MIYSIRPSFHSFFTPTPLYSPLKAYTPWFVFRFVRLLSPRSLCGRKIGVASPICDRLLIMSMYTIIDGDPI